MAIIDHRDLGITGSTITTDSTTANWDITLQPNTYPQTRPVDGNLRKKLNEEKKKMFENIQQIDKVLKKLDDLSYNKGDIVVHKDHGLCIVQDIMFRGIEPTYYQDLPEKDIVIQVAHEKGIDYVDPETIVKRTDLSESIYGK